MRRVALSCLLALALCANAAAQGPEYRWVRATGPGQWLLFRDDRQLGNWFADGRGYLPLLPDRTFGPPSECPTDPPEEAGPRLPARTKRFGVVAERLSTRDRYTYGGQEVTRDVVQHLVAGSHACGDPKVPDHRGKLRVVCIGPGADQVVKDFAGAPELAGLRDKVLAQAYPADHWHVAKAGYKCDGRPTVYALLPDALAPATGNVLHRQDDYEGGAAALAIALQGAVEQVGRLRPGPNYDPSKDVDRRRVGPLGPLSGPLPAEGALAGALALAAGGLIWGAARRKGN